MRFVANVPKLYAMRKHGKLVPYTEPPVRQPTAREIAMVTSAVQQGKRIPRFYGVSQEAIAFAASMASVGGNVGAAGMHTHARAMCVCVCGCARACIVRRHVESVTAC
jgi:hypothetical protein